MIERKKTREIKIGNKYIGGENPILIQSMCNTRTSDAAATVKQIERLEKAGCEIIRVAVPDLEAARAVSEIKKNINIPIVADIHFDYKLAIAAMENGADKIRINPGNIGDEEKLEAVVKEAKKREIPIRVGVNSGSLEKDILEKYGRVTSDALAESAYRNIRLIEKFDYENLVVSLKASDVAMAIEAHKIISEMTDYPIHVGITEAGLPEVGKIRSAVGIGSILSLGIGDTIRVSLTGDPVLEVITAKEILKSLGLRKGGIEIVSCPTCGRTRIDLIGLAEKVEKLAADYSLDIKIAVMGCVVNGPGEAKEADIGIAGGINEGILFKKGKVIAKYPEDELVNVLKNELDDLSIKSGKLQL